jgi:hypothetical protein
VHQFGFDFADPFFELGGYGLALQVITFENTYALDPRQTRLAEEGEGWGLESVGLCAAGGQQRHPGRAWLRASRTVDGLEIVAGAEHAEKIRCLKVIVRGLAVGEFVGRRWQSAPVPPEGQVLCYPFDPQAPLALHTPLVFLSDSLRGFTYLRSLDERVRCKRFAVYPHDGRLSVELIHEEVAHEMGSAVTTPPWRVGCCADPESVVEEHLALLERAYGIRPWETRPDVPAWAREIALVVAIHGMHWTGYVFHTYEDVLRTLAWVCERIEGRRVLAFLPGWEGRYYWQYGDYRPDPRLGGVQGFRKLAEGARALGVALMPMFGANCANASLPGFSRWGEPSRLKSASGLELQGNKPDWDSSRAHDPGWQAWLNPGAPAWRERLFAQVSELVATYALPAVFFDTHHFWENDPDYPVYEGLERYQQVFSRYCRTFGHLMTGDPSRASSGVHEAGRTGFVMLPEARHWWPTVTIVDGTLGRAAEKVERVIQQARDYARRYLA